jgi:urease accessory protein
MNFEVEKVRMIVTVTRQLPTDSNALVNLILPLTAFERTRSRHRFETPTGEIVNISLPRGTVLHDRALLQSDEGSFLVQIIAKPEPVFTAIAPSPHLLLKAAYHLGNRHVSVEIAPNYLRLSPDSVLKSMLEHLGLEVIEEIAPFQPETGAYSHHH